MRQGEEVGVLVRRWREHRRRSQLDLSSAADVSTRHLSFIETGRSQPSRTMIERLCEELEVPLRERNDLYLAAGLAPLYPERSFDDLGEIQKAIDALLTGHDPYPAVAVNVHWDLLAANTAMDRFLAGMPPHLHRPRMNMLRATLHPDGLSPQIVNHAQWSALTYRRVRRQYERTADPALAELLAELRGYSAPASAASDVPDQSAELITPMILDTDFGRLSLLYAVTVFGAPRDIAIDEIAIETFFPADEPSRELLRAMSETSQTEPSPSASQT